MQAVPNEPEEAPAQLEMFEGLVVQRYRLDAGSIGTFACIDENSQPLQLHEGDQVAVQFDMIVTKIEVGAGYKGGIQYKPRSRTHKGKVVEGSQTVIGVKRRS